VVGGIDESLIRSASTGRRNMIRSFTDSLRRYLELARWLLKDVLRHFWFDALRIILIQMLGMSFLLVTLLMVTGYARVLEQDVQLRLGDAVINPRESMPLLVSVGGAVLGAMGIGSWLRFVASQWGATLRAKYQAFAGKRAIQLGRQSLRPWTPPDLDVPPEKFIISLTMMNAKRCGRVAARLVNTLIPSTLVLAVTIPALFFVNAPLTVIVVALVAGSLAIHYRISAVGLRQVEERQRVAGQAKAKLRQLVQTGAHQPFPSPPNDLEQEFSHPPLSDLQRVQTTYRLIPTKSQFASDVSTAVVIVVIIVTLGTTILKQDGGWSELLIYLLLLRFVMGELRGLLATIVNSNRFYHDVRKYFLFMENTVPAPADRPASQAPREMTLKRSGEKPIAESLEEAIVTPGQRVAVLTVRPLTRFALPDIISGLLGRKWTSQRVQKVSPYGAAVTASALDHEQGFAAMLALPPDRGLDAIRPGLEACGLWSRAMELCNGNDPQSLDHEALDAMKDAELRTALLLLSVAMHGYVIIAIEDAALRRIDAQKSAALLDCLNSAIVLIVAKKPEKIGSYREDIIAVLAEDGVVGIGDVEWFNRHRDEAGQFLTTKEPPEQDDLLADDDDEEEFEDET
jgi:hypothetical protein